MSFIPNRNRKRNSEWFVDLEKGLNSFLDEEGVRVKLQNIQNETTMKVIHSKIVKSSQSGIQREIYSLKLLVENKKD